jgi:hypothetical protein
MISLISHYKPAILIGYPIINQPFYSHYTTFYPSYVADILPIPGSPGSSLAVAEAEFSSQKDTSLVRQAALKLQTYGPYGHGSIGDEAPNLSQRFLCYFDGKNYRKKT